MPRVRVSERWDGSFGIYLDNDDQEIATAETRQEADEKALILSVAIKEITLGEK